MLIQCPECGKRISVNASHCPNCGLPITESDVQTLTGEVYKTRRFLAIMLALVVLSIVLVALLNDPSSSSKKVVYNNLDGSVTQVKLWLQDNLKDPRSLEYIEWSEVAEMSNSFHVRVKYRAKNSFGGYVVENKVFHMDSLGVITSISDYYSQ